VMDGSVPVEDAPEAYPDSRFEVSYSRWYPILPIAFGFGV
jgi:hypothetical protein